MSDPIIIVGAGFGGLTTAYELAKRRARLGGREILLIDQSDFHLYTPLLYEVATGYDPREAGRVAVRDFEEELAAGVAFSFRDGLGRRLRERGIRFIAEVVTGVDAGARTVTLSDGRVLAWSALILAVGGETEFFGIEGLPQNSYQLKTLRHALGIRRRLRSAILRKQKGEEAHISIVIGGAGATGMEFAGELVRFFEQSIACGILHKSDITITIVEATHRLLPMFSEEFSRWAHNRLERWCVKFYFDSCIQSAAPGKVVLVPRPLRPGETEAALVCEFRAEKRKEIEADVLVWTGGVRGASHLARWGFVVDRKGRVEVDDRCRLKGMDEVFAIGDCAALTNSKNGQLVPALAQAAIFQSKVVAAQIAGAADIRYTFPYLHTIIPIGAKYALVDFSGWKFRGFFGWILRQLADLRYLLSILPARDAFRVWFLGARVYTRND